MIGFTPQQVDEMSMWQFQNAVEVYARIKDPEAGKKLSASEEEDLWQWLQTKH